MRHIKFTFEIIETAKLRFVFKTNVNAVSLNFLNAGNLFYFIDLISMQLFIFFMRTLLQFSYSRYFLVSKIYKIEHFNLNFNLWLSSCAYGILTKNFKLSPIMNFENSTSLLLDLAEVQLISISTFLI